MAMTGARPQRARRGGPASVGVGRAGYGGLGTARVSVMLLAKALLVPLASAAPLSTLWAERPAHVLEDDVDAPKSPDDPNLWVYLGVAIALVLLGGAFAGLTIALMGQDETYLQVISSSGEGAERRHATKVLNLLKKGKHWVLVTLLLSNVITNETLPIVLDRSLGGGWPAVLSSTVLIVIFGEIVPQSICVRYGLGIGSVCAPMVLALMWIMCPVAWPTAKLLDYLLGEDHGTMYKKAGLKTLVQLHKTLGTTTGERLMEDEVTIINSVLDLKEKAVGDIMTPMQDVFTMSTDTILDESMMDTILSQGYSRIPIYTPDNNRNFIGMLLVKMLITYDPEDAKRVRDFSLATLPETAPYTSCLDIINFFQEGKSHMVLVSDFPGQDRGALGVVTLEDVIEELIGEEIIDESDVFVDVHKAIRRLAPAPKQRYNKGLSLEPTTTLTDSEHDAKEDEPLLSKDSPASRKPSLTNGNAPGTTFLVRRKSSTTAERVNTTAADLRPQLRHLGPSNAASHPRATKFANVKIKPGVGTIPEGKQTTTGVDDANAPNRPSPLARSQSAEQPTASEENEETRLLRSAGKDASGGAAALMAGYGGTDSSSPKIRRMSAGQMSAHEASELAEQKAQSPQPSTDNRKGREERDTLKVPDKVVVGHTEESDQVGDMSGPPSRQRSTSRRAARSGSITETTVDYQGVKKVVLETTSSSSDIEEGGSNDSPVTPTGGQGREDDEGEEKNTGGANGPSAGGKKKKKKRGGKKKKGGDGA